MTASTLPPDGRTVRAVCCNGIATWICCDIDQTRKPRGGGFVAQPFYSADVVSELLDAMMAVSVQHPADDDLLPSHLILLRQALRKHGCVR